MCRCAKSGDALSTHFSAGPGRAAHHRGRAAAQAPTPAGHCTRCSRPYTTNYTARHSPFDPGRGVARPITRQHRYFALTLAKKLRPSSRNPSARSSRLVLMHPLSIVIYNALVRRKGYDAVAGGTAFRDARTTGRAWRTGSFGGAITLDVAHACIFRVVLSEAAWVDPVAAGKAIDRRWPRPRLLVDPEDRRISTQRWRHTLQLGGSARKRIAVLVTPARQAALRARFGYRLRRGEIAVRPALA